MSEYIGKRFIKDKIDVYACLIIYICKTQKSYYTFFWVCVIRMYGGYKIYWSFPKCTETSEYVENNL